jgi:hypothetical protein
VPNIPQAQKSFWTHMMELLGDLSHVESRFGLFPDSANLDARLVHGLCQKYHRLRNRFWMHPTELLGDKAQVEPHFSPFGDSANLDTR